MHRPTTTLTGVAFSSDGKTLATGSFDRNVKLWNIATQQEVATLEPVPGTCLSLRFSPDGRTLAAGSWLRPELNMSLWQVPSFEEIDAAEASLKTGSKQPLTPLAKKALFTSALKVPDRLMTDSHDKRQKLQAALEGVDASIDAVHELQRSLTGIADTRRDYFAAALRASGGALRSSHPA